MRRHTRIFSILTSLFLAGGMRCAGREDTSPEALISRARLQEIFTDGTPPMVVRADVQSLGVKGELVQGDYTLTWISPSRWREEIHFANYARLRVGDAKGYWQKSALTYRPVVIFWLDRLLDMKEMFRARPKQTLERVRSHNKNGIRQKCTEARWIQHAQIMCFDDANGVLVSVEYPGETGQNPSAISRIEYGEFKAAGEKLVPYEMRALRDKDVIAAVKIREIDRVTDENSALFSPPAEAEFWVRCDDMQDPELAGRVQPTYPPSARSSREEGVVMLYAVVESDGSASRITVIQPAWPELEAAAIEAVRQWHYQPARCGQTPIRSETNIQITFALRH